MTFRVGAALSDWARALRAHVADHAPSMEIVLVRDARSATESGLPVICLELTAVWVNRAVVDRLRESGSTVVAVCANDAEDAVWAEWGVTERIRLQARPTPHQMVFLLDTLRPVVHTTDRAGRVPGRQRSAEVLGDLLVVGGPAGSGVREVAIGLADRYACSGTTVLIDADDTGGRVAARVRYAEHPNLLTAVPAIGAGHDPTNYVARPQPETAPAGWDLIAGLPSSGDWFQVSPGGVRQVVEAARARWETVLTTTGPIVEDLSRWGDRYGITRELLADAPAVLGVCAASPSGVLAFTEWLAGSRARVTVQVVINKVPKGSPFAGAEVAERLVSLCGDRIEIAGRLPWDQRVVSAEWAGESVRGGGYSKALNRVANAVWLAQPSGAPGLQRGAIW